MTEGEPEKLSQRPVNPGLLPMGVQKVGDINAKAPQGAERVTSEAGSSAPEM